MRPSTIASPPVQPISASTSGAGSVRTTAEPKLGRLREAAPLGTPRLAQPCVLPAPLGPGRNAGNDPPPRLRELECPFLAEHREKRGERGPVAVDEAAVAAARPVAADLRLEQRHVQLG